MIQNPVNILVDPGINTYKKVSDLVCFKFYLFFLFSSIEILLPGKPGVPLLNKEQMSEIVRKEKKVKK